MRMHGLLRPAGKTWVRTLYVALLLGVSVVATAEDTIEFMSGARSTGTVLQIRKSEREVVFEANLAGRTLRQVYPYGKIHAVTYRGKRYVITKKSSTPEKGKRRSRQEIEQLITEQGQRPPHWFAETPLDFPSTLDLDWPHPAPPPWNNRKNVGQYIWDRINPNEGRWKSGVRLLHHLLTLHEDDKETSNRVMIALGGMYFRLFQDYARAAYWWRQAGVSKSSVNGVGLAECYYQLGNKRMALDGLSLKRIRVETIKLLGDMGETQQALQLADAYARQAKEPQWALLAAGDACRTAGKYEAAVRYYRRVLESGAMRNEQYQRRAESRANQSIAAIEQFELLDLTKVPDGQYEAESLGYEGKIAVRVTVAGGRIEDVSVTRHKEKQYYSALRDVPAQIIDKQGVRNVDATSRATITAEAIVAATAKALTNGGKKAKSRSFR